MYPGRRRRRSCSRKLDAFRRRFGCAVMMRRVVTSSAAKQRRGAVPLVIVVLAAQGACIRQLQTGLCPLQYVNRRLLINTENDRLGRRAM